MMALVEERSNRPPAESRDAPMLSPRRSAARFSIPWAWCILLTCLTLISTLRNNLVRSDKPKVVAKPEFLIDLNSATVSELEALPEVGQSLASRIVQYRDEHGSFATLESLLEVHGVGNRTLEQLRPMLFLGSSQPLSTPQATSGQ